MRSYGQYCPIARASEILAERWTPIIIRNLLLGCTTFNAIAEGAPGLSRGLLSTRLRELDRAGVIEIRAKPDHHPGSTYELTEAGRELGKVLLAIQHWGTKWVELTPEHAHPGVVLWGWVTGYLRRDRLPDRRTVIRFDFATLRGPGRRGWLLVDHGDAEICEKHPGGQEDLVVIIHEPLAFARWQLGEITWGDALRSGAIELTGRRDLARALPTWHRPPDQPRHDADWAPARPVGRR
jgi:DNA-binding HxlR family transcriptional regulator